MNYNITETEMKNILSSVYFLLYQSLSNFETAYSQHFMFYYY